MTKEARQEKPLTLYEINREFEELLLLLADPETGEINEEVEKKLEDLGICQIEKIYGCIRYVKNNRATALAMKTEADRMTKRAKVFANAADKTEKYLGSLVNKEDHKDLHCDAGMLAWTKSTSTEIDDPEKIPLSCCVMERKVIKGDVKKALVAEQKIIDALPEGAEKPVSKFEGAAHLEVKNNFKVK